MAVKPLTKAELNKKVSEASGVTAKDTNAVMSALSDVITQHVASGGAITLIGVGKIESRDRAARTVRNPRTGDPIHKPADRTPRMVFAKALKTACNE